MTQSCPIINKFVRNNILEGGGFSDREKRLISLAELIEKRMRFAEQVIENVMESATVYHDMETPSLLNTYIEFADKNDKELNSII